MANQSSMPQQLQQAETDIAVLQVRFTNLDEKIAELKTDLSDIRDDIEDSSERSINKIEALKLENNKTFESFSERIHAIEKWKWMLVGAVFVVSSLGSFISDLLIKLL